MFGAAIGVHDGLITTGRLPSFTRAGQQITAMEFAWLTLMGLVAALAAAFIDTGAQIPGQAIVRAILPMALGLSLVPRRLAGSVMSASAIVSAVGINLSGLAGVGTGAMTSLVVTGPALDLALRHAKPGWPLYASFVMAGIGSNLAALLVRLATKMATMDHSGRRIAQWLPQALWTYPVCGAVAGFVSALLWFHYSSKRQKAEAA